MRGQTRLGRRGRVDWCAARAAVYGGTYMLNKPVSRIVYNDKGAPPRRLRARA